MSSSWINVRLLFRAISDNWATLWSVGKGRHRHAAVRFVEEQQSMKWKTELTKRRLWMRISYRSQEARMQQNEYHPRISSRQPGQRLNVIPSQIIAPITWKIQCEPAVILRCCDVASIAILIVVFRICYSISMLQDQEKFIFIKTGEYSHWHSYEPNTTATLFIPPLPSHLIDIVRHCSLPRPVYI